MYYNSSMNQIKISITISNMKYLFLTTVLLNLRVPPEDFTGSLSSVGFTFYVIVPA